MEDYSHTQLKRGKKRVESPHSFRDKLCGDSQKYYSICEHDKNKCGLENKMTIYHSNPSCLVRNAIQIIVFLVVRNAIQIIIFLKNFVLMEIGCY